MHRLLQLFNCRFTAPNIFLTYYALRNALTYFFRCAIHHEIGNLRGSSSKCETMDYSSNHKCIQLLLLIATYTASKHRYSFPSITVRRPLRRHMLYFISAFRQKYLYDHLIKRPHRSSNNFGESEVPFRKSAPCTVRQERQFISSITFHDEMTPK